MKTNTQQPEAKQPEKDGDELDVHSVFHTIQGEGPFSGVPAVFVRLGGCNLQCPGCDTEYTRGRAKLGVDHLLLRIAGAFPEQRDVTYQRPRLIVITGGEPLRQDISKLCTQLLRVGFIVQVETNGTFAPPLDFPKNVKIVCSPKAGKVAAPLLPYITAYKYVIEEGHTSTADGLPSSILGAPDRRPARPHTGFTGPVYITPMDNPSEPGVNERNIRAASLTALTFGYIFQMQMHKLVGLP